MSSAMCAVVTIMVLVLGACGDDGGTAIPCTNTSCSGNGTCDDSSGAPVCTCDPGYTTTDCSACDLDYQDNDGDGVCELACDTSSCSGNGTCDDSSGTTVCTCDTGYTSSDCADCDTGFQDDDADGTCEPQCAVDACAPHGTCSTATGTAVCTCDAPYTGDDCTLCAPAALLDDDLDDDMLDTGGTNGGFVYEDNSAATGGTAVEAGGEVTLTTIPGGGGAEPNIGIISLNTIPVDGTSELTLVADVSAASDPIFLGITIGLQANTGWYELAGGRPSIELHINGSAGFVTIGGVNSSVILAAREANNTVTTFGSAVSYSSAELADGFTVVLTLSETEWSYTIVGLDAAPIVNTGTWGAGPTPSALFAGGTAHVFAAIQGSNGDVTPRQMIVDRLTVMDAICDPDTTLVLP